MRTEIKRSIRDILMSYINEHDISYTGTAVHVEELEAMLLFTYRVGCESSDEQMNEFKESYEQAVRQLHNQKWVITESYIDKTKQTVIFSLKRTM